MDLNSSLISIFESKHYSSPMKKLLCFIFIYLPFIGLSQTDEQTDSLELEAIFSEANLRSSSGQKDSADYFFDKAEDFINEKSLNDDYLGLVIYERAKHLERLSLYEEAISELESSIIVFESTQNLVLLAKSVKRKGSILKKQSKYREAISAYNEAAVLYLKENDSLGIAGIELNIGNVLKNIGQSELAKKKYFSAAGIYRKMNFNAGVASCYNNLGNVHKNDENYDSAFYYMYRTLSIRLELSQKKGLAFIYNNLSNLHKASGGIDSAIYYMDKSLELKEELGDNTELCNAYWTMAELQKTIKNYANEFDYLKKAEERMFEQTPLEITSLINKSLGESYMRKGNYELSTLYFTKHIENLDSLSAIKNEAGLMLDILAYESLSDSLGKEQIRMATELEELNLQNKKLQVDSEKRKFTFLLAILGVILLMSTLLFISFRKRLKASRDHQIVLAEQNEELKRTLISKEEKEVLLKEVHHRVKNNLQIINSLIRLQSTFINQSNYEEKLKDTENRIRSMALIHEKLYRSSNLAKLKIKNYIQDLCFTILETYDNDVKIDFKFEIDEEEFGIDSLIPLGLIINELLSNSIKYAFEGKDEGKIEIKIKFTNSNTIFTLFDNGMGADLTWNELKEESLGLELVESLTDQLDGKMDLKTNEGFHYTFTFPLLS